MSSSSSSSDSKSAQKFKSGFRPESILNRPDGSLPYGLYNPKVPEAQGSLVWNCGPDAENKITSVYCFTDASGAKDKQCDYVTEEYARRARDELLKDGWLPIKAPKVEFTFEDGKPLNHRQKKFVEKKLKKMMQDNPFKE